MAATPLKHSKGTGSLKSFKDSMVSKEYKFIICVFLKIKKNNNYKQFYNFNG